MTEMRLIVFSNNVFALPLPESSNALKNSFAFGSTTSFSSLLKQSNM